MGTRILRLLHIDDGTDDRALVKEVISLTQTPLLYYGTGCIEEAMPYFEPQDARPSRFPYPSLVLLDYDLGTQTGAGFLYWLRVSKKIKSIPVVMFSGSTGQDVVARCYRAGANYFIAKPMNLVRLRNVVRTLHLSLVPHRGECPIVFLHEYQPDPRKASGS